MYIEYNQQQFAEEDFDFDDMEEVRGRPLTHPSFRPGVDVCSENRNIPGA